VRRLAILLAALVPAAAEAQEYRFPSEVPASGTRQYITAHRDLKDGAGVQDYSCGTNAYNGHRGTDIGIGGFAVMDAGSRWVVAAADGEVATAVDGCFDRCTSGQCECGGGFGNYVKVTHADGKSTYYGHLLRGSVQVSAGARVTCGQRLGKVGSSGHSTGPHLHFEPRYANNVSDDPYAGRCGGPVSFWVAQGAYNALPGEACAGGADPTPAGEGTVKGVLWNQGVTSGPNDAGNVRLVGGTVVSDGGPSATARTGDAYWTLTLPEGTHRLTASAQGFLPQSREVTVSAGQVAWASMGLEPEGGPPPPRDDARIVDAPMLLEVEPGATFDVTWWVENTGTTTWAEDEVALVFAEGTRWDGVPAPVVASGQTVAPGEQAAVQVALTATETATRATAVWRLTRGAEPFGEPLELEVLVRTATTGTPDPAEDPDPEGDPEVSTAPKGGSVGGACGCRSPDGRPGDAWPGAILGVFALILRRRRRPNR
jgi:MYXO-CTERM domain-containing protein